MEWGDYFKEDNLLILFKSINKLILLMKIDKVIIINLEHRKDRRQQIIKELKRVGIDNFEFFKAVKPSEEMVKMWNPQFLNPIPQWFALSGGDHTKYRIGALGCMLSHMEIIKKCIEDKYENVLILEDDAEFYNTENYRGIDIIETALDQLSKIDNWEIFFLGSNLHDTELNLSSPNLIKCDCCVSTQAYILNKNTEKITSHMKEIV